MVKVKQKPHYDTNLRCGNCKWYTTAYRGLTCPQNIDITVDSQACIEYEFQPAVASWDKIRAEDTFLIRVFDDLAAKKYALDATLSKELDQYFVAVRFDKEGNEVRRIPTGFGGKRDYIELMALFEETQAYKDRTRKILLSCIKRKKTVQRLRKVCEAYIYKNWDKDLARYKSESTRQTIIDDVLSPLADYLVKLDTIMDKADLVLENLKDTHFALNAIKEISLALLALTGEGNGKNQSV